MQAYYSAEAGLEESLNALRGNIAPNAGMPGGSKINFRDAVTPSTSNLPTDTGTDPRLSGWLNYGYTPADSTNPDRIPLTAGYNAVTGLAYSVLVSDPDNTLAANGEPTRLLLQVTGYGPKGALKQMELIVNRTNFDYAPPATIMMRSADDCSAVNFTTGDSAAKDYSGHDHSGSAILPAFGATCGGDETIEVGAANKNTVEAPIAATIGNSSLPAWLQSADQARAFLADQEANAITQALGSFARSLLSPFRLPTTCAVPVFAATRMPCSAVRCAVPPGPTTRSMPSRTTCTSSGFEGSV